MEYVAHLKKVVESGELLLSDADVKYLNEMHISPGRIEWL